jgi:hypothetical protein
VLPQPEIGLDRADRNPFDFENDVAAEHQLVLT